MFRRILCAGAAMAACLGGSAYAQSVALRSPNFVSTAGASSVTLGGNTFVNQGMVGTARLPANLHDFNGETLGSFSGMAMDLSSWRRNADGSYAGSLYTLPDRGPNNIGGFTTTDYAARLNRFKLTLTPYTGTAAVASSVQQATLTQDGGILLTDTTGRVFTGRDPQAGVVTRDGIQYPTPPAGDPGAGKVAIDAEGLTFRPDGSFYVSDEYGATIYYFDKTGRQVGAIQATPDILPRVNGAVNFNGTNDAPLVAGTTGRRSNQGMEGVSLSPDGTRLFAVLQSAALQDNPTNVAVRRNNTRVLVYDTSATPTPSAPVAEYVLQLPVFNNSATGSGAPNATAAQSEVLALNNTQFLVLSRDGNGRGTNGNANAIAYKSILLVDVTGATNVLGTPFAGTTPISTIVDANGAGQLAPGIVPVQQAQLVNMLNTAQLTRFGINTVTAPSTQYTLSEKWEAMGLVPVLEEARPHDFFLLVGNDNDFVSDDIDAAGVTNANAALNSPTAGTGNNDNVIFFYRLTIPTYIDPQALAALRTTGPLALSSARVAAAGLTSQGAEAAASNLRATRRARYAGLDVSGVRGWGLGSLGRDATPADPGAASGGAFAVGVESGDQTFRYGLNLSAGVIDSDDSEVISMDGRAVSGGVYAGWFGEGGLYVQGAVGASNLRLDIDRAAAYGQVARGQTRGHALAGQVEVGYVLHYGSARVTPFVDVLYNDLKLRGYTERDASVSNGVIPTTKYQRTEATLGVEAAFGGATGLRPSVRLGYTVVDEGGDKGANLMLADLPNSAAVVGLPSYDKGFVSGEAALEGGSADLAWRAAISARSTKNDVSGLVSFGISKRF